MQEVPLIQQSRQSLSAVLGGNRWGIRIYEVQPGLMCADFTLADAPLITGVRCVAGRPLIPYDYLQVTSGGNFAFDTLGEALPWWQQFGTPSCILVYATAAEVAAS